MHFIDIPELQLVAVMALGFVIGGFFFDYWKTYPLLFTLVSTLMFFGVRLVPAFFALDKGDPLAVPGNGIISAAIMYVLYVAMMYLGSLVIHKKYGEPD